MTRSEKERAKRERRAFSPEFKMEAVRLMRERKALGVPLTQIGREFDVRPDMLRRWARQLDQRSGAVGHDVFPGNGQLPSAEAEVRRLQRENAVLRQERDFLKKAAVDSAGRCNTLYYFTDLEGVVHGTVRTSWPFCDPESGVVATLEKGRVAE